MRMVPVAVAVLCLFVHGCATHRSCCSTCGAILAGLGAAAAIGVADSAVDSVIDPKPKDDGTPESKRKLFDWEQRQQDNEWSR